MRFGLVGLRHDFCGSQAQFQLVGLRHNSCGSQAYNPIHKIYNRLDYAWLTPDVMEFFEDCSHKTVGNTDHKAVVLETAEVNEKSLKGLWRHNDTLNTNSEFQKILENAILQAIEDSKDIGSDQAKFEFIKFKMACCSREFSAKLKKEEVARKKNPN